MRILKFGVPWSFVFRRDLLGMFGALEDAVEGLAVALQEFII